MGFEEMWRELTTIGRNAGTGGYDRLPWTGAEHELRAWFAAAAAARGLRLDEDGYGNLIAWWDAPQQARGTSASAVLTGSHLDSVSDGGAYDGPLGVVSGLVAIDLLRERGVAPSRSLGVAVFAAEEGSRFGVACLGSRLATGALAWDRARELRDPAGVALADLVPGGGALLAGVGRFVELHVEQGRSLDVPVGQATGIWPHGRWRFEFRGEANHAGATAMADRRDPMLSYAMTALAANKQARLRGLRATFGRVAVAPNSINAIASAVTAWLDARSASEAELSDYLDDLLARASARAERDGTSLSVAAESISGAVEFTRLDPSMGSGRRLPAVPSQAGHDAGILAGAGIATSMLFVRNPTGVSHAPGESATTEDCLAGVTALADVLEEMVR